jgi:hypothetical protein
MSMPHAHMTLCISGLDAEIRRLEEASESPLLHVSPFFA